MWLISLAGVSLDAALASTSGSSRHTYLAKQLAPKGTLLSGYTLTATSSLANGVALLSGQGVNLDTEQNCPSFVDVQPLDVSPTTGLAEGVGCIYPPEVKTLADELGAAGLSWKAYVQGMGSSAQSDAREPAQSGTQAPPPATSCRHPEPGENDPSSAPAAAPYRTFRNPFVYFHSLLDGGACMDDDVDLSHMTSDLDGPATIPNLSWIVPSGCVTSASAPCPSGAPGELAGNDGLLKELVTQILSTPAYRQSGLIVIVPDSAPSSPASTTGKPVGALLVSPFVRHGARTADKFNDFSLLKSLARLFGVLPLGHANDPSVVSFGATVYSTTEKAAQAASASQPRRPPASPRRSGASTRAADTPPRAHQTTNGDPVAHT